MQRDKRQLREQTGKTQREEGLFERTHVVHPSVLTAPQLEVYPRQICETDEAVLLSVKTSDKDVDFFQYTLCPSKGQSGCVNASFLDVSPLVVPPQAGDYSVVTRACVYPNYSEHAQPQCGPDSIAKNFTAPSVSDQAMSHIAKQNRLREKMVSICMQIRHEMQTYTAEEPNKQSPLYTEIRSFLGRVGPDVCTELLLSRELMVLDDIAQNHPELMTPEPEKKEKKVKEKEAAPQIIQVYTRSPLIGLILISIGAAGIYVSGYQAFIAMKTTVSQEAKVLGEAIFLLDKKRMAIEVARLKIEKSELEAIFEHRANPDFISGTEENIKRGITRKLNEILARWTPRRQYLLNVGDQDVLREFQTLKADVEAGRLNSQTAWARMTAIVETYNARLRIWHIGEDLDDIVAYGIESPSQYRSLQRLMQRQELIRELRQIAQRYGTPDAPDFEAKIQARIKAVDAELQTRQTTWESYLKDLGSAAFGKGAAKAKAMAVLGAGAGVLLGSFVPFLVPGGRLGAGVGGAAVGGAVGFAAGAYQEAQAFIAAHRELRPTDWTPEDRARFESGDRANIEGLQRDIEARKANASRAYTADELKAGNVKAKLAAALPWLAGLGMSAVVTALGAREFALAASSAEDRFWNSYTKLYQEGTRIRDAYFRVQNNLTLNNCE